MLTEQEISELINRSGKLRMLSHKVGMFITLYSNQDEIEPWFLDELKTAEQTFSDSYSSITNTLESDIDLKREFSIMLRNKANQSDSIDNIVDRFMTISTRFINTINRKQHIEAKELKNFLRFVSTTLLNALNTIVNFFNQKVNELSNNKTQNINKLFTKVNDSLEEVRKVNFSIKILSFNASAEAARSGSVGLGFAVIADEMSRLNRLTRDVINELDKDVGAFLDEINS